MTIFCGLFATPIHAADLLTVMRQATYADPQLQIAKANLLVAEQNIPINRAALFPTLNGTGSILSQTESSMDDLSANSKSFTLELDQPIFNLTNWFNFQQAKMSTRVQAMLCAAALQNLMQRTAQAYFNELQAQDNLALSVENRRLNLSLWRQNKILFNAGLVKTADVDNAQAAYASSLGDVLTAQNSLQAKISQLQAITNRRYTNLATLRSDIPLLKPQPLSLSQWVNKILLCNLTVLSDRYQLLADRENIRAQNAGHIPTAEVTADYSNATANNLTMPQGQSASVNLTLAVPIFSGGKITAQTQQAVYEYQKDDAQMHFDYQTAADNLRENYSQVLIGVAKVRADQLTIAADQRALKSTQIAYHAGLSSISVSDVITAMQNLYRAQQNYVQDKYQYLISMINLKQAAGTLSFNDLRAINRWLIE